MPFWGITLVMPFFYHISSEKGIPFRNTMCYTANYLKHRRSAGDISLTIIMTNRKIKEGDCDRPYGNDFKRALLHP
jgi:hypothetical protein